MGTDTPLAVVTASETRRGIPARPDFLFAGAFPAARDSRGRQALISPAGDRLIIVDERGTVTTLGAGALTRAVGITAAPGEGWTVTERDGRLLRFVEGSDPRSLPPPFERATIATVGDGYVAARSPVGAPVRPAPSSALLVRLDTAGRTVAIIDTIAPPRDGGEWLARTAHVAGGGDGAYVAFFERREVRAYAFDGTRRWTVGDDGVGSSDGDQRGTTLGLVRRAPLLWLLRREAANASRLEALDERTGRRVRSVALPDGFALLTLGRDGTIWSAPLDTLDALAGGEWRPEAPTLALPTPEGDTIHLADLRGRVVLLNVWASWCAPCREEFPIMNEIQRELGPRGLMVVAVNEDRFASGAARFLARTPASFPIVLGGGRLRARLGYQGLPFTLIIDRRGRIAERIFGFAERSQAMRIRASIERLLAEP